MLDTTASMIQYQGDGGQSVFPIPFPFLETAHIRAHLRDGDGQTKSLATGVDFIVNRISDENGELVLLGENLPAGHLLTIRRLMPLTQEIFFHNQGPNSPRAMEEAADRLTMISQQLRADIDNCLSAPDPETAAALSETVADGADRIAAAESALAGKAPAVHSHAPGDVAGLSASLAAKADITQLALKADVKALDAKADKTALAGKADKIHGHKIGDVDGLSSALADKLGVNDPRLEYAHAGPHAASHAAGGADALTPASLGVLPTPPSDGKFYLAAAGGWIEYIPTQFSGEEGGGTSDHAQLSNRDAADQHSQSAIRNLPGDLTAIRASLSALERADNTLESRLDEKADIAQLPAAATAQKNGLLSAADKAKLDSFPAALNLLPDGGADGNVLVRGTGSTNAWKTPGTFTGTLPLMTATQKGVAKLASGSGLELDSGGALRIVADSLVSKINRVELAESQVAANATAATQLAGRLDGLGAMAQAADAPSDGKHYVRKNCAWAEAQAGSSGGSGGEGIVGDIRLLSFRVNSLPSGWYFCNGDSYAVASVQGQALTALPATFKTDWGIKTVGTAICLPNLFDASTGGGMFLRSVNGVARLPGSAQPDAIRNITGSFSLANTAGLVVVAPSSGTASALAGAFTAGAASKSYSSKIEVSGAKSAGDLLFNASLSVPTDTENRPINIGMTPAIYLGV